MAEHEDEFAPVEKSPTRYGMCSGSGDWIVGYLLDRCTDHPDKLCVVGSHVSSHQGWSEHDIRVFHHDKRNDGAEFVWLGHFTSDAGAKAALPLPACTKDEHPDCEGSGRSGGSDG